ncbi:MAG: alpha/beta hydrolase [Saonia sp.]
MKKSLTIFTIGLSLLYAPIHLLAQESAASKIESNVIYGMHGGLALLMDVYYPKEPNGYGIMVIPGSGFHQLMSYDATPLNDDPWYLANIIGTDNLLKNGYTLFAINHRSAPVFRFPAAVEDAQRAVQFVRYNAERFKIDRKKIGAIGHSSGGHLVSMLGTMDDVGNPDGENLINRESSKIQAVVALAGVFDLSEFATSGFGDIGAIASFVGTHHPAWRNTDTPRDFEYDLYAEASPITYITADDAAFFLVHGNKDVVVSYEQAVSFAEKLKKNKVDANLITIESGDHGFMTGTSGKVATEQYFNGIIELFDKHLQDKQ